jgi:hypothetical protein
VTMAAAPQHVIVIQRWRDGGPLYERYLDHFALDVSYIATSAAAASVPRSAAGVEVVRRTDDLAALATAAARLRQRVGPSSRIVALADADMDAAAELRVLLGCSGERPADQAMLRDRHAMLTAVAAAGIRVPRFRVVSQSADVQRLLAEESGPLLLTTRFGSATADELVVESPADAERLGGLLAEPMVARAVGATRRYSVDGIWDGNRLLSWRAARQVRPDGASYAGGWLGSVELTDTESAGLPDRLADFATAALSVLVRRPAAVHVAVFGHVAPGAEPQLSLDWVSTGMAGGELPMMWQEVHGVDLAAAAIASQLDRPLPRLAAAGTGTGAGPVGGWLQIIPPVPPPCRVTAVDFGPGELAPYAMTLPRVGELIPAGERVAIGLRFRAASTAQLERTVQATARGLRLECSPT